MRTVAVRSVSFLSADPNESENTEYGQYDGGRDADGFHREPVGDPVADEHGGNVRSIMPSVVPMTTG